jgi:hypothetical protein
MVNILDYKYLLGLLTDRKYWLVNEMKRCVIDKKTPLGTIRRYDSELNTVEEQIKHIKKEINL